MSTNLKTWKEKPSDYRCIEKEEVRPYTPKDQNGEKWLRAELLRVRLREEYMRTQTFSIKVQATCFRLALDRRI